MQVNIAQYIDRKGMTSRNLFDVIPVGKYGKSITQHVRGGTITMTLNSNIRDNDIKVAVIVINFVMQDLGKDCVDQIRDGASLINFDENGQLEYIHGIKIKATDLSEILYKGNRKRGKRIFTSILALSNLNIRYQVGSDDYNMSLFQNIAYINGNIIFDIANYLVTDMIRTMVVFRVHAILENDGLAARLALYTEMNQRPFGKYRDTNGVTRTKYVPLNTYNLEDIIISLGLQNLRKDHAIKNIKNAFVTIHKNSQRKFPKYTYNNFKKTFQSEYKNGRKSNEKSHN